jgi:nucleoid-associated protein YgaU
MAKNAQVGGRTSMRNWLLVGIAAFVLIGIGLYVRYSNVSVPAAEQVNASNEAAVTPPAPVPVEAPPVSAPPKPAIEPPSFDIVRVEPTGELVIGGRGEPGAGMALLDTGKAIDSAKVAANGQFAMVPEPLKPGSHNLTLSMKLDDGQTLLSTQNIAVDVPDIKTGPSLVAKTEPGKPTQLLTPAEATPTAKANPTTELSGGRAIVAITVVEAEDAGTLYAAGKAAPGAALRLYLNDTFLAPADVGTDASWALKIAKGVVPGQYRVRVDDVDPATGKVLSRAEVPFSFSAKPGATPVASQPASTPTPAPVPASPKPATVVVDSILAATVSRGDSLWRISRKAYGSGYRYTEIHRANQEQIRDPDLIYPGQIFVLPKLKP